MTLDLTEFRSEVWPNLTTYLTPLKLVDFRHAKKTKVLTRIIFTSYSQLICRLLIHIINWRVTMKKLYSFGGFIILVLSICFFSPLTVHADEKIGLSNGQTIYVPAYSHIYIGNREQPFFLTVTLSIRNIDPKHQIKITVVDYYETQGKLLKKYLEKPVILKPLESLRYIIPESDKAGGSGANFIVEWKSDKLANPPIIESIMISTRSRQGVSFTSRGQTIINPK